MYVGREVGIYTLNCPPTYMSKEYKKKCSNCGTEIIMSDASGKWQPMETDNATIHRCMKAKATEIEQYQTGPVQTTTSQSHTNDEEIAALKARLAKVEDWIRKVSNSAMMNL